MECVKEDRGAGRPARLLGRGEDERRVVRCLGLRADEKCEIAECHDGGGKAQNAGREVPKVRTYDWPSLGVAPDF